MNIFFKSILLILTSINFYYINCIITTHYLDNQYPKHIFNILHIKKENENSFLKYKNPLFINNEEYLLFLSNKYNTTNYSSSLNLHYPKIKKYDRLNDTNFKENNNTKIIQEFVKFLVLIKLKNSLNDVFNNIDKILLIGSNETKKFELINKIADNSKCPLIYIDSKKIMDKYDFQKTVLLQHQHQELKKNPSIVYIKLNENDTFLKKKMIIETFYIKKNLILFFISSTNNTDINIFSHLFNKTIHMN